MFQIVSAFGHEQLDGYSSRVLKDQGDRKSVEFHTPLKVAGNRHIVRSVEWVQLQEPERIDFWLAPENGVSGLFALSLLEDSFVLEEKGGCTEFRYESRFAAKTPLVGWLLAKLVMTRVMGRHMDEHVVEIKELCEARAIRSKVFPQRECGI